jgi:arabinan endo-1,5-alpha-L-arabinosidase
MLAFIFFFIALAAAYPNRGACTGDCWTKDPAVIQRNSDGKFFRFGTGTGIPIITSDSIKGPWTAAGKALPNGSKITVSGVDSSNIWVSRISYYICCITANCKPGPGCASLG